MIFQAKYQRFSGHDSIKNILHFFCGVKSVPIKYWDIEIKKHGNMNLYKNTKQFFPILKYCIFRAKSTPFGVVEGTGRRNNFVM